MQIFRNARIVKLHCQSVTIAGLPLNETTIAASLKEVGYSSGIIGKWHLGVGINNTYLPGNHGFDYYLVVTLILNFKLHGIT